MAFEKSNFGKTDFGKLIFKKTNIRGKNFWGNGFGVIQFGILGGYRLWKGRISLENENQPTIRRAAQGWLGGPIQKMGLLIFVLRGSSRLRQYFQSTPGNGVGGGVGRRLIELKRAGLFIPDRYRPLCVKLSTVPSAIFSLFFFSRLDGYFLGGAVRAEIHAGPRFVSVFFWPSWTRWRGTILGGEEGRGSR